MSQSRNPTDTQALLQSMLQRLKLQPGRDGQANLYTPPHVTAPATWGQDGEKGPSSPINGFVSNGSPVSNFVLRGGETQRPGHGGEVDRDSLVSFPTQKDNTDGDTGEKKALGQATQPGITPSGTGQLFPAKSLKDADIASFERTDGERLSFGRQSLDQYRGYTPKSFVWSLKHADANLEARGHEDKALHVGNGGFGAFTQNKDMQIVPTDQTTTNSSTRRKQRSSEKTRRWTQKIKERWRDRSSISGKKEKDGEGGQDLRLEQGTEPLTAETHTNTSNKEEERILPSPDSNDSGKAPLTADATNMRLTGDFEFGLGSFSLLEEIVTGQEWAKFLNPNQPAPSANQRPQEEPKIAPPDGGQSPAILNQHGGLSFRGSEASPVSSFSMAQVSSGGFLPVSMDVSEGKQAQGLHKETDQSEPMEHGHTQSDARSGDCGSRQRLGPPSFAQPADILNNSALKSRVQLNRKRQHQSAKRTDERPQAEKSNDWAERESPTSSLRLTGSEEMEDHDNVGQPPPPPLFPSSPFVPAPKGVLKHSISQDSEAAIEIVTKRRRVEENRRVRFSEEVLSIEPPEMDLDATDSEEDSVAEDDSVLEQECEVEQADQAVVEGAAPARRPALPAWILALRRSTGRKHR